MTVRVLTPCNVSGTTTSAAFYFVTPGPGLAGMQLEPLYHDTLEKSASPSLRSRHGTTLARNGLSDGMGIK